MQALGITKNFILSCVCVPVSPSLSLSLSLCLSALVVSGREVRLPAQIGLVGDTAVLECNTSIIVTTSTNLVFMWSIREGGSLPAKALFTQNNQTLILSNLTLEDNQMYRCLVVAPDTGEFYALTYPLSVFGKSTFPMINCGAQKSLTREKKLKLL